MMGLLEKSIDRMARLYPNLACETGAASGATWQGILRPIGSDGAAVFELLDDIHHGREIFAAAGGTLMHLSRCSGPHCRHSWIERVGDLTRQFEVVVNYSGGREHPRCWVLSPEIPPEKRRHMWSDGSMCPFLASEDVWEWRRDSVAEFMPHAAIWLVKWMVFDQTGEWIGPEHEGTPQHHLAVLKPSDQCWCRSGRKYLRCHMRQDQMAAF